MKIHVSDLLRRVASFIVLDEALPEEPSKDLEVKKVVKPHTNDDTVQHEVVEPTARPKIKPTRKDPASKPSVWDSKQHRKEYMQNWRAEGKDVETGNKYVPKKTKKKENMQGDPENE